MPADDIEEHRDTFQLFDKVGDGNVECVDIGNILRALGLNPTEGDVNKIRKEIDPTGEKRLSFEEFSPIYQTIKRKTVVNSVENFSEGFRIFDRDNNGMVSVAEIRHLLTSLGEALSGDEVDMLVTGMEDGKGMINYEEFVRGVMNG